MNRYSVAAGLLALLTLFSVNLLMYKALLFLFLIFYVLSFKEDYHGGMFLIPLLYGGTMLYSYTLMGGELGVFDYIHMLLTLWLAPTCIYIFYLLKIDTTHVRDFLQFHLGEGFKSVARLFCIQFFAVLIFGVWLSAYVGPIMMLAGVPLYLALQTWKAINPLGTTLSFIYCFDRRNMLILSFLILLAGLSTVVFAKDAFEMLDGFASIVFIFFLLMPDTSHVNFFNEIINKKKVRKIKDIAVAHSVENKEIEVEYKYD